MDINRIFTNPYLIKLLYSRNIKTINDLELFDPPQGLEPKYIADIPKAASVISEAVQKSKNITIFGDYDADGILSSFILYDLITRFLNYPHVDVILPRRSDGYGLTGANIERIKASKPDLLILVDNGIAYANIINQLAQLFSIIVIDHHTYQELPSKAKAIVHPSLARLPTLNETCSTVLAYKLAEYMINNKAEIYSDIAALGVITDIMPVVGENRLILKKGLNRIRTDRNSILARISKTTSYRYVDTFLLGNIIGPQLNAPGRLKDPKPAFDFIMKLAATTDTLPNPLLEFNNKRRNITEDLLDTVTQNMLTVANLNIVISESIPKGIVGLIASRITEGTHLPTLVFTKHQDTYHGSGRAPNNFNLIGFLRHFTDLFIRLGGHTQAAGFEITRDNLNTLIKQLKEDPHITKKFYLESPDYPSLNITINDLNHQLLQAVEFLEPFGHGNPYPTFTLQAPRYTSYRRDSTGKHLFIRLEQTPNLIPMTTTSVTPRLIWWNAPANAEQLIQSQNTYLIGTVHPDTFQGTLNIMFKIQKAIVKSPASNEYS